MLRIIMMTSLLIGTALAAQEGPMHEQSAAANPPFDYRDQTVESLAAFKWERRPLIVFADSENDPNYQVQIRFLEELAEELAARDVVVLTDTDPSTLSALRRQFRPRGFMLVLIGKDGTVKQRKPLPWDVREISRAIDKMPMRQREIQERRPIR